MTAEKLEDYQGIWTTLSDNIVPTAAPGMECLKDKYLNKGLAFSHEERQLLGINGLLPPAVRTLEEQVSHSIKYMERLENDLDKFIFLTDLSERNQRLFFNLVATDIARFMPLIYTPVVGLACQKFSLIYQGAKGLFITMKDKGHVLDVLKNWPEANVRAIVVTDGERILGLGDLGANGMGIPIGKLLLYTCLAGFKPDYCLPVTLDVGTNTQSILDDPLYIGLRQKRTTGQEYEEFIDEFMQAAVERFGRTCLIQFEDFANYNAFPLLKKYRNSYCCFNDDIQGTGAVALAGLVGALRITKSNLPDMRILFQGAGESAIGIAHICVEAMIKAGLTKDEAKKRIWLVDSKGLVVKNRPKGGLTDEKLEFAQDQSPIDSIRDAVEAIKPTVLIGCSSQPGTFNKEVLETMTKYNKRPIIFALSNPTHKSECTAEDAYKYTNGSCVFASGSPFSPVVLNGKTYYPSQCNNAYIFPGLALGAVCAGLLTIPDELFILCANTLSALLTSEDLDNGRVYPPINQITECSLKLAVAVVEHAFKTGIATAQPEPTDKLDFVKSQMYKLG